jgi:hypothetical protein
MRCIWTDDKIAAATPLWRYFKTDRLLESLDSRILHFPSVRQFADPFEGAVAVQPQDWPVDSRYSELDGVDPSFEQLRRLNEGELLARCRIRERGDVETLR